MGGEIEEEMEIETDVVIPPRLGETRLGTEVENGVKGEFDREVGVPPTVEDRAVVEVAKERVREYFQGSPKPGVRAKL